MVLNKIRAVVGEELDRVNNLIMESLKSDVELLNGINSYIYERKGKQLRPLLSLLAAKASGELTLNSYACAAVVEIIHTATLLHDDVADNAAKRRGSESVQARFSPGFSVLTGDYWLSKALALLVESNDMTLIGYVTTAVQQLSEGELFQLEKAENLDTSKLDYIEIVSKKTSSLFAAAIVGGAHSVGASKEVKRAMANYAYYLGVAFQIRDDVFDYIPSLDTGKEFGKDIKDKKLTLPLICALDSCDKEKKEEIINFIKESKSDNPALVKEVFAFVKEFDGLGGAESVMEEYSKQAVASLEVVEESPYKSTLIEIAHYVGKRAN